MLSLAINRYTRPAAKKTDANSFRQNRFYARPPQGSRLNSTAWQAGQIRAASAGG